MGLSKKFLFLILVFYSIVSSANDSLLKESHKIYFKHGNSKIFLFNDDDFCFDKDAFSIENLTNDGKKYLFVNYTDDCNPSGKYQIFDISKNKAEKFYLSPLYDPTVDSNKKQIIENFKVGAITYTRIYALKNGKYDLLEEIKTLGNGVNLSVFYSNSIPIYSLKNDSNQIIKNTKISSQKAFLFNESLKKTKAYLIQGDNVDVVKIIKKNDLFYLNIIFHGKSKSIQGYIKLSDIL